MPRNTKPTPCGDDTEQDEETRPVGAGRPNDLPIVTHPAALPNSTLASRAQQRFGASDKVIRANEAEAK
jgi:hypothetical protein